MKRKTEHETQCIRSESEVPVGYVPMLDFGDSNSYAYKRLSKAQQEGAVRAVKLVRTTKDFVSGRVWVHENDARSHLTVQPKATPAVVEHNDERSVVSPAQLEAAVVALCEINNGITLMLATLERLTTAVESIATQPDYAASLRREIAATCESSNGYHN